MNNEPKSMLRVIKFTKKQFKKVKPNENINIYCVFSASDHQISVRIPCRSVLKSNLEPMLEFVSLKSWKMNKLL